jgi:hypothetical protein
MLSVAKLGYVTGRLILPNGKNLKNFISVLTSFVPPFTLDINNYMGKIGTASSDNIPPWGFTKPLLSINAKKSIIYH